MKNILLLIALMFTANAMAVCSSPISRTNNSANSVLTSTKLNLDFNTAYTRLNELPGDCITAESVTTTQIDDGTIVNADISASAAIAPSKLAAPNYTIGTTSTGNHSTASTSLIDVTNLTASITTTGKPVEITVIPDPVATENANIFISTSSATGFGEFVVYRGATVVGRMSIGVIADASGVVSSTLPPGAIRVIDTPAAGTYTYKIQVKVADGADLIGVGYSKLFVREL